MAEVKVVKKKDISETPKPVEKSEEYVLFSKRELADIHRRWKAFEKYMKDVLSEKTDLTNIV